MSDKKTEMKEIEIYEEALSEYQKAHRLKKLNEQLSIHLHDSIYYLLKYSEKHDLPLPNKSALLQMIENTDYIIDQFVSEPKFTPMA
jgi:hypothetical protein